MVGSGANRALTDSVDNRAQITRSADGRLIAVAGYDAPVGTSFNTLTSSNPAEVNRVLGLVDATGTFDTRTADTAGYNGATTGPGRFWSVATVDGSRFWTSGDGDGTSTGVRTIAAGGASASTLIYDPLPNQSPFYGFGIIGGQLYLGTGSGGSPVRNIFRFDGLPTSASTPTSIWTSNTVYVNGFALVDRSPTVAGYDTLYLGATNASGTGQGIYKFTLQRHDVDLPRGGHVRRREPGDEFGDRV